MHFLKKDIDDKKQKLLDEISKLKKEEKELKKNVSYLRRKKLNEESKFINYTFSVLVAAAVGGLLNSLSTYFPLEQYLEWVSASFIIIILTIGFIGYTFEKFPDNAISGVKTFIVISGALATFAILRYYHYLRLYTNPTSAIANRLNISYLLFLSLFSSIGVALLYHAYLERDERAREKLIIAGIAILLISIVFFIFVKPPVGLPEGIEGGMLNE